MNNLLFISIIAFAFAACNPKEKPNSDFNLEFGKVANASIFSGADSISIWGGSLVKGEDGLYHMFYSRWARELGNF